MPEDGYTLIPRVVADVLAAAIDEIRADLENRGVEAAGLGSVVPRASVGLGHSPAPYWLRSSRLTTNHTMLSPCLDSLRRGFRTSSTRMSSAMQGAQRSSPRISRT